MKVVGRTAGVVNVGVLNDTSWIDYAGIRTTANQGWTYYTQKFYMNDHGSGDSIRFYVDGTPNSGASFYIDAITLTPDMAGIAATETRDNTHLYQTFTYTPAWVYSASEYMTKFKSIDITQYAINGCSVTVGGVAKTSYVTGDQIYFDASGLLVNPHSVIVTLTYPAQKPIVSFTPDCTVGYSPLNVLFEDSSPVSNVIDNPSIEAGLPSNIVTNTNAIAQSYLYAHTDNRSMCLSAINTAIGYAQINRGMDLLSSTNYYWEAWIFFSN